MSTETKPAKPLSKKKILNKAKYAVISAERAERRARERRDEATVAHSAAEAARQKAQIALDALLAA